MYSDDEDMEADATILEREEKARLVPSFRRFAVWSCVVFCISETIFSFSYSARIARREEQAALEEERRHEEEKRQRKKERERAMARGH